MDTIEQLRETARQANEAIYEIEVATRREKNGPLVGQTFKYRNCCSCPDKPSDYWWLYSKVTRMDKDGIVWALQFQIDKNGDLRIDFDHCGYHMQGHTPIPESEFRKAWKKIQAKIGNAY